MNTQLDLTFRRVAALGGGGLLTSKDIEETGESVRRVYALMRDSGWYTREQIELAAGKDGKRAHEGLRRMRELRAWCEIEKQRLEGRVWVYRLKTR
jgi:hypothetical protein